MLRDVENAEFRQKVEEGRKEVREALGIFDEEEPTYTEAQAKAVLGSFKGRSTSATPQLPRGPGKLAWSIAIPACCREQGLVPRESLTSRPGVLGFLQKKSAIAPGHQN